MAQRSTTSAPSRAVRRMPGPRQPADDVVAGPGLQSVGLQLGLGHAQGDRAGDLLYDRKGNASRPPCIPLPQAVGGRLQPAAELATEPAAEGPRASEDRRHHRRPTAVRELELEVVDLAGVLTVLVDQLPVQQLQPGLDDPSSHRVSFPPWSAPATGSSPPPHLRASRRHGSAYRRPLPRADRDLPAITSRTTSAKGRREERAALRRRSKAVAASMSSVAMRMPLARSISERCSRAAWSCSASRPVAWAATAAPSRLATIAA